MCHFALEYTCVKLSSWLTGCWFDCAGLVAADWLQEPVVPALEVCGVIHLHPAAAAAAAAAAEPWAVLPLFTVCKIICVTIGVSDTVRSRQVFCVSLCECLGHENRRRSHCATSRIHNPWLQ